MKRLLLLFIMLTLSTNLCKAATTTAPPKNLSGTYQVANKTPAPPPYTNFTDCLRIYQLPMENLLYVCLSAITDNNYQVEEIQFKTGTIVFTAYSKEFILITANKDYKNSFVKILPSDNNYNFSTSTINRIFNYIETNSGLGVQNII